MFASLQKCEAAGERIRVGLIGAGRIGLGIAWHIERTPGMDLVAVADLDDDAARTAAQAAGNDGIIVTQTDRILGDGAEPPFDVLVETSTAIGPAARLFEDAITQGVHVVLMNAEVDLAAGPELAAAARQGVVLTSDAGDQHGALMRMIDEIRLWGMEIVMAGNIKGYLDRYATAAGLAEEARVRKLDPAQCCGNTDGTKLAVEMALVANGAGLVPAVAGMQGPRADNVREVLSHFNLEACRDPGVVDYILGAEPGGGVFVIGYCDHPLQADYLSYYKMGDGPFYLFYRPYHLCHLETPWAIAAAVCHGESILQPWAGRITDVYAHAKRGIATGKEIPYSIGGDQFYGLIEKTVDASPAKNVPIVALEADGDARSRIVRGLAKDQPLIWSDIELPPTELTRRVLARQETADV